MNVTSQAISKWENDLSYPDLASTKELASVLNVSVEELLNGESNYPVATNADAEQISRRILIIHVQTADANVIVRIPVSVLMESAENGTLKDLVGGNASQVEMAIGMIKEGVTGTLIEVKAEGNFVQISVEDHEN